MKNFSDLLKKFSTLDEENQKKFLNFFFTKNEIKTFEERIKIIEWLKNKKTQREISSDFWISITTVTRWNKVFKVANEEVKNIFW